MVANHKGCRGKCTNALETVTNLSSYKLSNEETSLLSKGLKFIPDRSKVDKLKVLTDLCEWERRMRLREYFFDKDNDDSDTPDKEEMFTLKGKASLLRTRAEMRG